jgi:hypothetical protein
VIIGTCHRFPPKRMDLVTFDFLSPFVESKMDLRPLSVHSKVMLDDSEYSDSNSMACLTRLGVLPILDTIIRH